MKVMKKINKVKRNAIHNFFYSLKSTRDAFVAIKYIQAIKDTNRYYFLGYKTGLLEAHIITVKQWFRLDLVIHKLFD